MTNTIFPPAQWGKTRAVFLPRGETLPDAPVTAALVFAMQGAMFVLADIMGRGWCVPGGHLEAGESEQEAVRREAYEEAGLTLGPIRLLGHYTLKDEDGGTTLAAMYVGDVERMDPLPPGFESRGVRAFVLADIPTHYYTWDALLAAVFAYAQTEAANATS